MPFTLRSIARSSALIVSSVDCPADPCPAPGPAPVVTPACELPDAPDDGPPDDCAVPELLVPGDEGDANLDELPAPLGSLPELLRPAALAGSGGMPFTPADPAPAEPALGLPADGPLAEAPALAPPAPPPPAPPEPPPPPPPPTPCAKAVVDPARITIATNVPNEDLVIGRTPFTVQRSGDRARSGNRSVSKAIDTARKQRSVHNLSVLDEDIWMSASFGLSIDAELAGPCRGDAFEWTRSTACRRPHMLCTAVGAAPRWQR